MGQNQGRPQQLDAKNINIPQNQQNSVDQNFQNFIKQAFRDAAINGQLYKDKFNEALAVLENFQIKRLRNTPLGERLFTIFDLNKRQSVDENEFLEGLTNLINDKDTRILYTFKAIDKDEDNKLSRKEFLEFFEESWKAAFRLLGDKIQKGPNVHNVQMSKINSWATQQIGKLNQTVNQIFQKMDPQNRGYIQFMDFKNWIKTTDIHSIIANFDNESVDVPVNLYEIQIYQQQHKSK